MKIFDLCTVFPKSKNEWGEPKPERALNLEVRAKIKESFGSIFAASDLARRNSPSRLGLTSRNYEWGDPFRAVHLPMFARTGNFFTKLEEAPGRAQAVVVFHSYSNLEFQNKTAPANKGQVGLWIASVLRILHLNLSQTCQLFYVNSENLYQGILPFIKKLRQAKFVYIVTDGFYLNEKTVENLAELSENLKIAHLYLVRDPQEWTQNNPLSESHFELFSGDESKKFSGTSYITNLEKHWEKISKIDNLNTEVITGDTEVEVFLESLLLTVRGSK